MWALFWDMHSGGSTKYESFDKIYVEAANEAEARTTFARATGRDPAHVTCNCCGKDYSVSFDPTLERASAYHRNCRYDKDAKGYVEEQDDREYAKPYVPLAEYLKRPDVLVIESPHKDILAALDEYVSRSGVELTGELFSVDVAILRRLLALV